MNLLLLFLFSCGNGVSKVQTKKFQNDTTSYSYKKDGILYLDLKTAKEKKVDINLSDICDSVIYIPLETKKNCLLNHINQIELDSKNIFIKSGWSFFRFGISGKFLNQYGKTGRGPGEYACGGFCLDRKNKIVYPSTIFRKKRYKYTYDGKFLKSMPKENVNYASVITFYNPKTNSFISNYAHYVFYIKRFSIDKSRLIGDEDTNGISRYVKYSKLLSNCDSLLYRKCGHMDFLSNLYSYKNERYMISEACSDTIFEYENKKLFPKIILNNKKFRKTINSKMFREIKKLKDYSKITKILSKDSYSIPVNESERYLFLTSLDSLKYIYNKIKNKLICVDIYNNIDGLGNVDFTKVLNNKYLYGLINSDKFIELAEKSLKSSKYPDKYKSKLKSVLGKIDEESNPILILYKIKN